MNCNDALEKIINGLKEFDGNGFFTQDSFLEFERRANNLEENIKESQEEGRLLKIGIVGEIKAGKSSFLNSMIFDGEDILPKASTPMTAALTKISYASENTAKIVFYSEKDWDKVRDYARRYDEELDEKYNAYVEVVENPVSKEAYKAVCNEEIPIQYRSCKELMELADRSNINVEDCLGQEKEISCSDFGKSLDNYIGAEGDYTAIVKHVELGMNNPMLEGIEIVDTPGMNDPIVSRGETTKGFLQKCDVVFLLSYCGQFLTQEDITFMAETLPREGVKNLVIIGSKLDSGVLDSNYKEFDKALVRSKRTYDDQAKTNVEKSKSTYNRDFIAKVQESLPPLYISSLMYDVAKKTSQGIELAKYEQNIITQFQRRFSGFSMDKKDLLAFSGIPKIRGGKLKEIKIQKDQIIAQKNKTIVEDSKGILMDVLAQISTQVNERADALKEGDIEKLEKRISEIQDSLNKLRTSIKNVFEKYSLDASKLLNDMHADIDLEIQNYIDIDIQTEQTVEYHTVREGFLGLKKRTITESITIHHASVSDVISNIRSYIARCKQLTNETFANMVNINKLEKDIKDIVLEAFRKSDKEFNENDILIPLAIVIGKIKIPKIEIDIGNYQDMIIDSFSNASVSGKDIETLKLHANRTLERVAGDIQSKLRECDTEMSNTMKEQSIVFVDDIIKNLSENIEAIRAQIEDKEGNLQRYEELKKKINEYVGDIREMEI